jgi:hypothetical protein
MKTKWERFCDWLNGPEPEPLKSAWPLPPPPPEPIRPFVAKLVECIRLGDCKWEDYYLSSFGTRITFALAEDLPAALNVITFEPWGVVETPRLGGVSVGGEEIGVTTGEAKALMDAYRTGEAEKKRLAKIAKETARVRAIAKIEAYTPKAPSPAASQMNQP